MADVNRRGSTVRDERAWVEPSPRPRWAARATCRPADIACAPPDVTSATMGPVSEQTSSPSPRVRPTGRDRRVRDARGRRQGQGAQGRRPPRDRLRRRRARLPDARRTSSTPRSRPRRTPSTTGTRPRRVCRRCARRSPPRRCATPATRSKPSQRARHQRRQAGGLPGVRGDRGPGRRGAAARAVLDHLPRGDPAGGRRARSRCSPASTRATW